MKSWMRILAIGCTIALSHSVAQAEEPASATKGALTPADETKLREQIGRLAGAFGVEPEKPAAPPAPQPAPEPEKKTMAEVADKALDMASGLVGEVAATLQKVAPHVWRIMVKQQYAKAAADLVLPWGLVLITFAYMRIMKKRWPIDGGAGSDEKTARKIIGSIAPACLAGIFAIWGVIALGDTIKYLINPEFYAIRDLLIMLLNKGQVAP